MGLDITVFVVFGALILLGPVFIVFCALIVKVVLNGCLAVH